MYIPQFLERENMKIYLFGLMHSIGKSFDCGWEEFQILEEIFIPAHSYLVMKLYCHGCIHYKTSEI